MFRGFDTSAYPGDAAMRALRPYFDFVCFYLPSPSHHDDGWMEKRSFLVDELGYGTIPLYVGQQITGPGSHIVTPEQGVADGQDMVAVMSRAGYPFGSRGFNDLENGAPMPSNQQGYAQGMGGKVVDLGWLYGLYASHSFADVAAHVVPGASIWTFKVPTTNKTTAVLPVPDFPDDMAGSGYPEAMIWQYRQNVTIQVPGVGPLLVDLNVATVKDPSAP